MKETITWITDGSLPDSDLTVLLCTSQNEVDSAFHDGDNWRWAGSASRIASSRIKAWSPMPEGPKA